MEQNRTKLTHETYVNDNPPDPKQIRQLAMVAFMMPKRIEKVRVVSKQNACYSVLEADLCNEAALIGGDRYPSDAYRRLAVRFGSRACEMADPTYSLKFYDTQWVKHQDGWTGVRDLYRFEWGGETGVQMAEKSSIFVPSTQVIDMQDLEGDALEDSFRFDDDAAGMLAVRDQLSQVTSGDCELLIGSVEEFYANERVFVK